MPRRPAGCLFGFLANLFSGHPESAAEAIPKVIVNKFFISDAERNFFLVLRQVVGNRAHILAQVSIGQLLYFPSAPNRQAWKNRATPRALDFLLCHPTTLRPLLAIELDEPSHTRPDRQTRDEQVETLFEAAGLPLIHVLTSRSYSVAELAATILPHLGAP